MAIYHLSVKIIGRSAGRSVVAAAAYRSGEKLVGEQDHRVHNYQNKKGIAYSEILLPEQAPPTFFDRSTLWNAVEKIEKGKKAQLAREVEVALPVELSLEEHIPLLKHFIQKNFVDKGMCADFSIHDKGDGNPHSHILLTMRALDQEGQWRNKKTKDYILDERGQKQYDKQKKTYKCKTISTTDWDQKENLLLWRENWAKEVNQTLASQNITIDHRSYKAQGISKIPTIHLGQRVVAMERKGLPTEIGRIYKELVALNAQKEAMEQLFNKQQKELEKEKIKSPGEEVPASILFLRISTKEAEQYLCTLYDSIQNLRLEEIQLKSSIDKMEQTQKAVWNKRQSIGKQYQAYLDSSEKVKKLKTSLKEEERKPFLLRNRRKIKEDTHSLEQLEKERRQQIYLFKETFGISPVNNPDGKRKKQQEYKQVYLSNQRRLKDLKQESFEKKAFQTEYQEEYMDGFIYLSLREDGPALCEALGNHIEPFQTDKPNDPMSRKKSIVGQLEAFKEKERFMPETISQEDYERAIKRLQDYEPDKATALRNIFLNTNIQEKKDLSQER